MHDIALFIKGFKQFQKKYFCDDSSLFDVLKQGQNPNTLVITCVDSRIDPALITGSPPGELLVVRNVAGLVPPYAPDTGHHHGVSSALEFAVTRMEVEHIIVLGHSSCGGIQELRTGKKEDSEFLNKWVSIADQAMDIIETELAHVPAKQQCACELGAILLSLENLLTFPWIRDRVAKGSLYLHGWYFDMDKGELSSYLPESRTFEKLTTRC